MWNLLSLKNKRKLIHEEQNLKRKDYWSFKLETLKKIIHIINIYSVMKVNTLHIKCSHIVKSIKTTYLKFVINYNHTNIQTTSVMTLSKRVEMQLIH